MACISPLLVTLLWLPTVCVGEERLIDHPWWPLRSDRSCGDHRQGGVPIFPGVWRCSLWPSLCGFRPKVSFSSVLAPLVSPYLKILAVECVIGGRSIKPKLHWDFGLLFQELHSRATSLIPSGGWKQELTLKNLVSNVGWYEHLAWTRWVSKSTYA